MKSRPERICNRWFSLSKMMVLGVALLALNTGQVMAQTGESKDTKKLREKVEHAREAVQDAEKQVRETMAHYNSIFEQTAKKPESAYKKLTGGIEDCDKAAKDARKSVDSMTKELEAFFVTWAEEISAYSIESLKEQSQKRLEAVKGKFDRFNASLEEASKLYRPFIAALRDHASFLGRDLSPETLTALEGEAKKLNDEATALYAKVDEALNDTGATEAEAVVPAGEAQAIEPEGSEAEAAEPTGEAEAEDSASDPYRP